MSARGWSPWWYQGVSISGWALWLIFTSLHQSFSTSPSLVAPGQTHTRANGPHHPGRLPVMPGSVDKMVLPLQPAAFIQLGLSSWAPCHPKLAEFVLGPSWQAMQQSGAVPRHAWANEPGHRSLGAEPGLVFKVWCNLSETREIAPESHPKRERNRNWGRKTHRPCCSP